jgi:hypothetical protein
MTHRAVACEQAPTQGGIQGKEWENIGLRGDGASDLSNIPNNTMFMYSFIICTSVDILL